MQIPFVNNKDVYSGLLIISIGLFAAYVGKGYKIGTISNMGPGFVPMWLGIILSIVGLIISFNALRSAEKGDHMELPDTRGSVCIIAGILSFIICAEHVGLVLASLSLILISAMGDRKQTWQSASLLALIVTIVGVGVFSYALNLPFSLVSWEW